MDYLVIGNSAAGIGAVEGIRKNDREGSITLVSDEPYHTYSRPMISYYLSGKVDKEQIKYRSDDFYHNNKVETRLGVKVIGLDTNNKIAFLKKGKELKFDKLIIATGGQPFYPPIKGIDKDNVYSFVKLDDARAVAARINNKGAGQEKAIILGAGLIGLKAAEALVKIGVKVTVVELADQILNRILDKEAAGLIQSYLEDKGINFNLEDTVEEFIGEDEVKAVRLQSDEMIDCDLTVIAVGVRPGISLVAETDITVNRGILVNNKLETSIKDIYAAGDVAEGYDMLRGTAGVIPIWPNAYNQGFTAGLNMAGVDETYQEGFARNSIGFFNLPMITAGIINPGDNVKKDFEILTKKSPEDNTFKKVILRDNKVVGFIYITSVDRAGILTGLIKEEQDISLVKDQILNENFGYLSFEKDWRKQKILR